jgi:outer membrane murein-binding lipoprotein Lpp
MSDPRKNGRSVLGAVVTGLFMLIAGAVSKVKRDKQ